MKNYDLIIASGATICYNRLAKDFSHMKTGGKVDVTIFPNSVQSLVTCLENTNTQYIFGGTTNSLFSDNGLEGEVILTSNVKGISVQGNKIIANCGELLAKVCHIARDNNLTGMEELCGIPGTIGGAINMNAGAFGKCVSDIVESVTCFANGKIVTLSNKDCGFGYRTSDIAKNNFVVLSCTFLLDEGNQILISNNMKNVKAKRRQSQPNQISLGSVFKKHDGISSGYYIENCKLKGVQIGGCMVSPKHANFIVNTGGATSGDFAKLAKLCEDKVFEKYNIKLLREVKYFGEFIF